MPDVGSALQSFEIEVRVPVNRRKFAAKLRAIGAQEKAVFRFTDEYYKPKTTTDVEWQSGTRTMRLRRLSKRGSLCRILYDRVTYMQVGPYPAKKSLFPEGKVELYASPIKYARMLLEQIGFQQWFIVKRKNRSTMFVLQGNVEIQVTLETIEKAGSLAEISCKVPEGELDVSLGEFDAFLKRMGIYRRQIEHKTMAQIILEGPKPRQLFFDFDWS